MACAKRNAAGMNVFYATGRFTPVASLAVYSGRKSANCVEQRSLYWILTPRAS